MNHGKQFGALAITTLVLSSSLFLSGCGSSKPKGDAEVQYESEGPHKAPHWGILLNLGDHTTHLELVIDQRAGTMTAYFLDGTCLYPVCVPEKELFITFDEIGPDVSPENFGTMTLRSVPNLDIQEAKGEASIFSGTSEMLQMGDHFSATIKSFTVSGKKYENVGFGSP